MQVYKIIQGRTELFGTTSQALKTKKVLSFVKETYMAVGEILPLLETDNPETIKDGKYDFLIKARREIKIQSWGEVKEEDIGTLLERGFRVARLKGRIQGTKQFK